MHLKRLIIALILLPLFYLYVTRLSAGYFVFLLIIVGILAQYEFYSMYKVMSILKYMGIFGGLIFIVISYQPSAIGHQPIGFFAVLFLIIACIRLFSKRSPESSLYEIAAIIAGVLYIPLLLSYQIYLRNYGAEWIIFLYGCVWASDSLAYYIGSSIGKKKLYREISPHKTIEGAVSSIAGGAVGAIILKLVFVYSIPRSPVKAVILGMIIGIVSVIGDLVESMFKRDAGVKDSSNIVPGHGGILDKLDSSLFAGPVLYWTAMAFGLIK
ncbi:MAG: phosphatidate cytidylyltransferase [Nitrospirae bacterium]|nr:phosphatidate cytidylyltransferase [Nitrospirota bacterium]